MALPLLLAASFSFYHSSVARAEDKTFASEIAKNGVPVQIIASGEQTLPLAREWQNAIIAANHPKAKAPYKKDFANVSVTSLAQYGGLTPVSTTRIFLLIGDECRDFPSSIRMALPSEIESPASKLSVFESRITSDAKNMGAFSIVLFAPDAERFKPLYEDFVTRRFGSNFRDMGKVSRHIVSNRVALFSSPQLRAKLGDWGHISAPTNQPTAEVQTRIEDLPPFARSIGAPPPVFVRPSARNRGPALENREIINDVRWFDIGTRHTMSERALEECAEVYFVDRSSQTPLPTFVMQRLHSLPLKTTSILTWRGDTPDGRPLVIFAAPTATLLAGRYESQPNLSHVPKGPQIKEAVDLRRIGRTVLLVNGGDASPAQRETIRLDMARAMRQQLNVVIEERGKEFFGTLSSEETLRQLQGDVRIRERSRAQARSNWIWMFTLTQFDGESTFNSDETMISSSPAAFNEREPDRPRYDKKNPRKSDRDFANWQSRMNAWNRSRELHEYRANNADYQWRRVVNSQENAAVRGVLRLVNLADQGHVEWEQECASSATNSRQHQADTVSIRGFDSRPSSLSVPASRANCSPELMNRAARQATSQAIASLRAQAWFPGGTPSGREPSAPHSAGVAPKAPPVVAGPRVAALMGNRIVLTIGVPQGVRAGDLFSVALASTPISDPVTGQILDYKVTESLTVRVVGGNKTAECIAHTPADAARWNKLKPGQVVKALPRRTATPQLR